MFGHSQQHKKKKNISEQHVPLIYLKSFHCRRKQVGIGLCKSGQHINLLEAHKSIFYAACKSSWHTLQILPWSSVADMFRRLDKHSIHVPGVDMITSCVGANKKLTPLPTSDPHCRVISYFHETPTTSIFSKHLRNDNFSM